MSPDSDASPVDRILDATGRVIAERGVAKARVGDIADHAGLGRATVYRYFATREDIFVALAEREMERFVNELGAAAARRATARERVIEAVASAVEGIATRPTMAAFFAPDALAITATIPGRSARILPRALGLFQELVTIDGVSALAEGTRLAALGEWLMRMVLSLAMVPGPPRGSRALRTFIGTLLSSQALFRDGEP